MSPSLFHNRICPLLYYKRSSVLWKARYPSWHIMRWQDILLFARPRMHPSPPPLPPTLFTPPHLSSHKDSKPCSKSPDAFHNPAAPFQQVIKKGAVSVEIYSKWEILMNSFDLIASCVIMRARERESRFHFAVYPMGLRVMRPIIWEKSENCKNHAANFFFFLECAKLLQGVRMVWNNEMKWFFFLCGIFFCVFVFWFY